MPVKTRSSIKRISYRRRPGRAIHLLAVLVSVLAMFLIAAVIWSFIAANDLMRKPAKPLANFSSNVLPEYRLISFTSLDEQTMLSGWFFPANGSALGSAVGSAKGSAFSTVILIHDQGENRLQFDLATPAFYRHLTEQGLNVLSFDLRNSGQSGGDLSSFGYAEWTDVLAAIQYARKNAATTNVLLYGFGTGVSAAMIAWDQLPPPDSDKKGYPKMIRELDFDQSYIIGLLLDSPASSPDDYIRAVYRDGSWIDRNLLRYTVPYAVRLSAGGIGTVSLTALLARCQPPVFIAWNEQDTTIGTESAQSPVQERIRLHPDLSVIWAGSEPGHIQGFLLEQDAYLAALDQYLNRFFVNPR